MKLPRLSASSLLLIRFPAMLGLLGVMLVLGHNGTRTVADGIGLRLFNSARFEEASRVEMEFTDLANKSYRFVKGDPSLQPADLTLALDVFWSRIDTLKTSSYKDALASADLSDNAIVHDIDRALPELEKAVLALRAGDVGSFAAFGDFAIRHQEKLLQYSDRAYLARRKQMQRYVEQELESLEDLKAIQQEFVGLSVLALLYVLAELYLSRRGNHRLNAVIDEKQKLVTCDHLTGIANRRHFEAALTAHPMDRSFAVILVDLDGFKAVNDTSGHAAGDNLLKDVAGALERLRGPHDVVSRLGGDEFAILLEGSRARAAQFADDALAAVARGSLFEGRSLRVSASIGVAHSGDAPPGTTPAALMKDADTVLYAAKAAGRHCVRFTSPDIMRLGNLRQRLQTEIGGAIENGELDVDYQPILSLADGRTTGIEALIRWHHPDFGPVSAAEIIAAAEQVDRILPLTLLVADRACKVRNSFAASGLPLQIGVNVSPRLLGIEGFAEAIIDVVRRHDLGRGHLVLEITEDAMMAECDALDGNLRRFREEGIDLAVDDFGKGYSNLGRLADLAFRKIKIDKSLIDNLATSSRSLDIVRSINRMATDLGMDVVAEGVETVAQMQALRGIGMGFIQGYHHSRPLKTLPLLSFILDEHERAAPQHRMAG